MSRDINPFGLRMPSELRERIEAAATKSGRSLNAEILQALEKAYPDKQGISRGLDALMAATDQAAQADRLARIADKMEDIFSSLGALAGPPGPGKPTPAKRINRAKK